MNWYATSVLVWFLTFLDLEDFISLRLALFYQKKKTTNKQTNKKLTNKRHYGVNITRLTDYTNNKHQRFEMIIGLSFDANNTSLCNISIKYLGRMKQALFFIHFYFKNGLIPFCFHFILFFSLIYLQLKIKLSCCDIILYHP